MKNTETENMKKTGERTLVLWTALGIGIGAALGASTDNMGLWVGMGAAFGSALGFILIKENRSSK